jgi:hypothetical protein
MPPEIEFEILWYRGGPEHAPNRVIGRDYIMRTDLSLAIATACNMLKEQRNENARLAHGFYVRRKRPE